MKILREKPPIYDNLIKAGLRFNPETTIFTYGDTIYNPTKVEELPDNLIAHEETHSKQQLNTEGGPDAWWERYIGDQYFRIDQEAEAYGRQYEFICRTMKDRNRRCKVLWDLAFILASPTYGSVIDTSDARRMIEKRSK